jgi:glycosyltransferase involved in cell wall biosynthesis
MPLNTFSVAVLMATYNGEKLIGRQIESILNQSYQDFELIISDDGSTDHTIDIIKKYVAKYPNIKFYQNKRNIGFVKNFEKLIKECQAQYIALSDQDDIWLPDKLKKQLEEIYRAEKTYGNLPVLIHSDLIMVDEKKEVLHKSYFKYRKYKLKDTKDLGHILGPCGVMGNTVLFNQKLKEKILPFPPILENHDYWIALINELLGKRITITDPLVQYVIHESNASNSFEKLQTGRNSFLRKSFQMKKGIKLPYVASNRKETLDYLLQYYVLKEKDRNIIERFMKYLCIDHSKALQLYDVAFGSFIKKDWFYRMKIIFKILVSR